MKGVEWLVVLVRIMAGIVDEMPILAGVSMSRTLYTAGRTPHDLLRGLRASWVALGVDVSQFVGGLTGLPRSPGRFAKRSNSAPSSCTTTARV